MDFCPFYFECVNKPANPDSPHMSDEPECSEPSGTIDGSSLCLSCGICCRGALYPWAMLDKDELDAEETAGVKVISYKDEHAFCLPCGYHNCSDNSCSIYGKRFKVCSRYKCDLLKKALAGEVDLDAAPGYRPPGPGDRDAPI